MFPSSVVSHFEKVLDYVFSELMSPNQDSHFIFRIKLLLNNLNLACHHNVIFMPSSPSRNLSSHNETVKLMIMVLRPLFSRLELSHQLQIEPLIVNLATFVIEQ